MVLEHNGPHPGGLGSLREIDHVALARCAFGIAMSGFGTHSDREKSLAAGYKHHLTKPFLPEDLDALLASAAAQLRQKAKLI